MIMICNGYPTVEIVDEWVDAGLAALMWLPNGTCGASQHGQPRIVTRFVDSVGRPLQVTNYAQIHARALRVLKRLVADGFQLGDCIATLASNTVPTFPCALAVSRTPALTAKSSSPGLVQQPSIAFRAPGLHPFMFLADSKSLTWSIY